MLAKAPSPPLAGNCLLLPHTGYAYGGNQVLQTHFNLPGTETEKTERAVKHICTNEFMYTKCL